MYLDDLETYIATNRRHFARGGDVIRCGRALSAAILQQAVVSYDPSWSTRQAELDAALGSLGLSPGATQPSPSAQLFTMAQQISWLADVLAAAAEGNYEPLRTPASEQQQLQAYACQVLGTLSQDPMMRGSLAAVEPKIKELVALQHQMIVDMALSLRQ
jgi:hypothetical protein